MNRKERRAAEHAARKAERKAGFPNTPTPTTPATESPVIASTTPEPVAAPKPAISEAQLAANRANAQHSTGAKTEAGKAKCSHNAVKTALTGQTVLLPTDDVAAYQELGQLLIAAYKPGTYQERLIVQSIIDTEWRLMRITVLEHGILAIGRRELAGSVPAETLEADVYLKYERNLKNLALQENRLRRSREKDLKELLMLQTTRYEFEATKRRFQQMKEKQQQQAASQQPAPEPANGFVFSTPEPLAETPREAAA